MGEMFEIFKCVVILFVFTAAGFLSVKTKYIKKEIAPGVSSFVTKILFPVWIAGKILSPSVTKEQIISELPLFLAGIVICILLLGVAYIVSRVLRLDDKRKYTLYPLLAAPNASFLGVPVCEAVFGDEGSLACAIIAMGTSFASWTVTISVMARGAGKLGEGEKRKFHLSPVTVAFFIALIIKICGITLPDFLLTSFSKFGGALSYTAMVYLGISLAGVDFRPLLKEKLTYIFIPLKSLILPVLIGVCASLTGLFNPTEVGVITVVFAASPMISMTMFYKEYGLDYVFANTLTFCCLVLDIITIPVCVYAVSLL